jgi:hypothetical protein
MRDELPVIRDLLRMPGASPPAAPAPDRPLPWVAPVRSLPVAVGTPTAPTRPPLPRRGRGRGAGPLAVVIVLVGVFVTGIGLGQVSGTFSLPNWFGPDGKAPPRDFPVLEPSRPTRIKIASLGVDATVHGVGIGADGTIEVPAMRLRNEAGWYDESPTPGQFGPSILVGHVDTRTGPAVFHKLADVRPGAKIEVTRRDRSVAVFEVNTVESFDKSAIPADRVYGDFSRPGLRLITCGGRWVGGATGYADNVIVFASLVSARNIRT